MPIPAGHKHTKGRLEIPKERYILMREPMETRQMICGQEESHTQVMKRICLICSVQSVKEITCPYFVQWEEQ